MALEKKEVMYAKELNDVFVLFVKVASLVKGKGDYASAITELIAAIDNCSQIPEEFKADKAVFIKTALDGAVDIANVFIA
jgi:hypothetical protein